MKKFFKWYTVVGFLLFLLVACPLGGYWYVSTNVLTPQKLKQMLQTELAQSFKGSFDYQSINLTYWETWPTVSICIQGGTLKGIAQTDSARNMVEEPDLCVDFKKLFIDVNFTDYLKEDKITVEEVVINEPKVRVITGNNHNLFDLFIEKESDDGQPKEQNIKIEKGSLEWFDLTKQLTVKCEDVNLKLNGNVNEMKVDLQSQSVVVDAPNYDMHLNFPLHVDSKLGINQKNKYVDIQSATASVENIPFEVAGKISFDSPHKLWMDVNFNLLASNLNDLFQYIPPMYLSSIEEYNISGATSLQGSFKGYMGRGSFPTINLKGKLTQGSIIQKNQKNGLDKISTDFQLDIPSEHLDSSLVEIKDLTISGLNSSVMAQIKVKNLIHDPFIDMSLKSDINLNRLGSEFLNQKVIQVKGDLKSDIALVFKLADLQKGYYDRIWANGSLEIKHLLLNSDRYNLHVNVSNTSGLIGYKENQSHFIQQREVLGADLHADTLKLRCEPHFFMNITDMNLSANTGLQQDTSSMTPITTHLKVKKMQAKLFKDIAMLTSNMKLHLGLKSSAQTKDGVDIAAALTSDSLEYLNLKDQQATKVVKSQFMSEIAYQPEKDQKQSPSMQNYLQQSTIKGYVVFDQLHSYTQNFPLHVKMFNTKLGFKNNYIILNNAQVQVGKSDALINGNLKTTKDAKTKKSFLEGNLDVKSGYLNLNELKKAYLFSLSQHKTVKKVDANARLLNIENLEESLSEFEAKNQSLNNVKDQLLKVPNNCALGISFTADNIDVRTMQMQKANGKLKLVDEKAIVDFASTTNMGDISGNFTYKYRTPDKAEVYFDCHTHNMQVGKVKKVFPEVNTIFPLLYTMDGVLNADIVTFFPINAKMDIDLSSLFATCNLRGQKMVLFTNDVYHQIASKFHFKDKEANPIEHIDVDFIAKDNQIEVFPFVLDIDRCSFLIGGEHSMNMDFKYHIDVLKSFVPIDFGINVNGNIDNIDYQLGKIRFKELFNEPIRHAEFKMEKMRKINEAQAKMLKLADKL